MLSATLYRIRKDLAKKPWVIVLAILAVAFAGLMIFTGSLAGKDAQEVRNLELSVGAINVISIIVFGFVFSSGLTSGAVGFTYADVNFHLAGPFTPKFNLLLASSGIMKMCGLFLWIMCCQSTNLSMMFGFRMWDLIALLLGNVVVMCLGYSIGVFFCAFFNEKKEAIGVVRKVFLGIYALFVVISFGLLYKTYGSIGAIRDLGLKGIVSAVGSSALAKFFPVAGWTNLVYAGITYHNNLYILIGIITTVAVAAGIVILFLKCDVDYYESAMIGAQKLADLKEAKRAGVDTDTTKLNAKVKVGKETLKKGWGASAFTYRHFLENTRGSKLFFVNPLGITYRIITFGYGMMMDKMAVLDTAQGNLIAVMVMMIMLNAVVYGGGKTILEFNRPYIFMIPEKASKKLMACLAACIPEMLFDSILCGALVMYFGHTSILVGLSVVFMMMAFDLLFQLIGLMSLRIFKSLGRMLLITLRTFIGYGIVVLCIVPGIFAYYALGAASIGILFGVAGLFGAIVAGILMLFAKDLVDKVEFA